MKWVHHKNLWRKREIQDGDGQKVGRGIFCLLFKNSNPFFWSFLDPKFCHRRAGNRPAIPVVWKKFNRRLVVPKKKVDDTEEDKNRIRKERIHMRSDPSVLLMGQRSVLLMRSFSKYMRMKPHGAWQHLPCRVTTPRSSLMITINDIIVREQTLFRKEWERGGKKIILSGLARSQWSHNYQV